MGETHYFSESASYQNSFSIKIPKVLRNAMIASILFSPYYIISLLLHETYFHDIHGKLNVLQVAFSSSFLLSRNAFAYHLLHLKIFTHVFLALQDFLYSSIATVNMFYKETYHS